MNRNDLDEALEEKVVGEDWHRLHADIFNLLDDLDAPVEDVRVPLVAARGGSRSPLVSLKKFSSEEKRNLRF